MVFLLDSLSGLDNSLGIRLEQIESGTQNSSLGDTVVVAWAEEQ